MSVTTVPHRLPANFVPVYYAGGANIAAFRGEASATKGPEDWIGSVSALPEALLGPGVPRDAGVSRLADGTSLRDAVAADRAGWLGPKLAAQYDGGEIGLLVKLLDAGERLPVHAHPDRPFAAARLASPFGKTEGWIVMDDSPGGDVWLGFSEDVPLETLKGWIDAQDVDAMLAAMNRLPASPGAVFYVPAGVPHAIGPGVMITELQEPTSFSILAEFKAFGLNDEQATLGLGWAGALPCFDRTAYRGEKLARLQPVAKVLSDTDGARVRQLFGDEATPFFQAMRVDVRRTWALPRSFSVVIIEDGEGLLRSATDEWPLTAGQTWVVPHGAAGLKISGAVRCLISLPPAT